jgi:hypothetical protein
MAHTLTAQDLYHSFNQMPEAEKKAFLNLSFLVCLANKSLTLRTINYLVI